jgi:hypothetical protein
MNNHQAIYNTHPEVKSIRSDGAYDIERNLVELNDALVQEELAKLQAVYDSQLYARNREAEYPSIADQLDDIYHNGIDAWKATIKTTKDKYPKP